MLVKYMRTRYGLLMYSMDSVFREALKRKSENRLFGVWFLADQRPPRNSRFWTRFLNHETAFFEGVEKISKKLDMAVVFIDMQKVKRGYYEVHYELLFESTAHVPEDEITLTCVKKIEEEIRRKPEYWLWSHKRFKHVRPDTIKLIES
jgi:KDO2-lipid IV(A) lauroyltransferase